MKESGYGRIKGSLLSRNLSKGIHENLWSGRVAGSWADIQTRDLKDEAEVLITLPQCSVSGFELPSSVPARAVTEADVNLL